MLLAPIVLAAALGQACPEPPSRYGPPPCAAANVPGCVPGYRRQLDAWGRETYVCDRQGSAAPAPAPAPQPYAQPVPAPRYAPPPPGWAGPPVYAPSYRRGLVGFTLMPGGVTVDRGHSSQGAIALGLELRPPVGGARLRFGYEYSDPVSVLDVSFKYDFLDGPISPFLSVGLGGAWLQEIHDWRGTGSISGGLDLYLTRDIFASVELKARGFAQSDTLNPSSEHATSLFMGVGFYF